MGGIEDYKSMGRTTKREEPNCEISVGKAKGGTIFDLNLVGGNLRGNYVLINSKRVTNTRINTQIISNVIEKRTHILCSLFNNTLIIC